MWPERTEKEETYLAVPLIYDPRDLDLLPPHCQLSLTANEEIQWTPGGWELNRQSLTHSSSGSSLTQASVWHGFLEKSKKDRFCLIRGIFSHPSMNSKTVLFRKCIQTLVQLIQCKFTGESLHKSSQIPFTEMGGNTKKSKLSPWAEPFCSHVTIFMPLWQW